MIDVLYVEREVADHPRARAVIERFPDATRVECDRYTEVLNPRSQNFRLQKRRPALILARKPARWVLETPPGYGLGARYNYYFSHMLNCVYDCRYCFLQGMYRSAHYVLFVNFEDFADAIAQAASAAGGEDAWFFSGYDGDSLALDPLTGFVDHFLPLFAQRRRAFLELRTKSTQVRSLLARDPLPNVVTAFSFTPAAVSERLEHRVPAVSKRLEAAAALQRAGWPVALRFDPMIYHQSFETTYRELFRAAFEILDRDALHSVSLGPFRLPRGFHDNIVRLYPDEPLFAGPFAEQDGVVSYPPERSAAMESFCRAELARYIGSERVFDACGAPTAVTAAA